MKKIFFIAVVFALLDMGSTAPAGLYLYESDGTIYEVGAQIYYDRCQIYTGQAYVGGHWANAIIFYDAEDETEIKLKITVFEDANLFGWTIEGDWEGDGSYMMAVVNFGAYYETFMFIRYTLSSRMCMPQIPEIGFNPKVKPHALATVSTPWPQ